MKHTKLQDSIYGLQPAPVVCLRNDDDDGGDVVDDDGDDDEPCACGCRVLATI